MKRSSSLLIQHRLLSQDRHNIDTIPVVFLRAAQSTWNKENLFIGWTDTPLTSEGVLEARVAGKLMKENGLDFDEAHTSVLRRSIKTVWLALQEMDLEWISTHKDWRLNEQQYGALVGKNRKQCAQEFGAEQVKRWRRSWLESDKPPPIQNMRHFPGNDPRYEPLGLSKTDIPLAESMFEAAKRTDRYWDEAIVPRLRAGKRLLICAHGGNIRSMIKRLDNISQEQSIDFAVPRCWPLVYYLERSTLKPIPQKNSALGISGVYLGNIEEMQQKLEKEFKLVYDLSHADENSSRDRMLSMLHTIIGPAWASSMGPSVDETVHAPKDEDPDKQPREL